MPPNCLARIGHVAANIRKTQVRREKHSRARCTMESKIKQRRMPSDGLPELQQAVRDKLKWAMSLQEDDIDKDSYLLFMGIMYSALYVFSAQGRISGVMDMSYGQARELLSMGFSTTDQFKTNHRWGLQPVTLSDTTGPLLEHYLTHVRPRVCREDTPADSESLWLRYCGRPEEHIGTSVTSFFKRTLNLHITTTSIRSLVETSMSDLHDQGLITNQQLLSVQAINGHTSAVAKDYYIHKARGNDVIHAREAFSHLSAPLAPVDNLQAAFDSASPKPLPPDRPVATTAWSQAPKAAALQFGMAHPDFGTKGKRARWTEEEVSYIGSWCANKMRENPHCTTLVAQCREHILTDPFALPIFHSIHVLDSGRLRTGYRAWVSTQKEGFEAFDN